MTPEELRKREELEKSWEAEEAQKAAIMKKMGWNYAQMAKYESHCCSGSDRFIIPALLCSVLLPPLFFGWEALCPAIFLALPMSFLLAAGFKCLHRFIRKRISGIPDFYTRRDFLEPYEIRKAKESVEAIWPKIDTPYSDHRRYLTPKWRARTALLYRNGGEFEEGKRLAYLAKIEKIADDWQSVLHARYLTSWPEEAKRVAELQKARLCERESWYAKLQERRNEYSQVLARADQSPDHSQLARPSPTQRTSTVALPSIIAIPSPTTPIEASKDEFRNILDSAPMVQAEKLSAATPVILPEVILSAPEIDLPVTVEVVPAAQMLLVEPEPIPVSVPGLVPKPVQLELELQDVASVERTPRTRNAQKKTQPEIAVEPMNEGQRKLKEYYAVERNRKLIRMAKQIHGLDCCACGKNFERLYGKIGRDYIQIHHLKRIADGERKTDPATDLAPLCGNCHLMADKHANECARNSIEPPRTKEELKRMLFPNGDPN